MAASGSEECTYRVFLSFNADDTGRAFSDHLYAALEQSGTCTFRSDYGMETEEIANEQLEKAMRESKVCIVVFSRGYAASVRCLEELVKMMELRQAGGPSVMPVFYDADPNQVWDQSGSYAEAFARHEETVDADKVKKWRAILREATCFSGLDLEQRHEAEFIQDILGHVQSRLDKLALLHIPSHLVGIHSRVKDINLWLQDGSTDPGIAIISGMGGVGKTTIAKTVFNLNLDRFEGSCFLANVRETSKQPDGLIQFQNQLLEKFLHKKKNRIDSVDQGSVKVKDAISCRRVLLVLDDVDELDQLNAIIGTRESLYQGSKIIITTRLERLLGPHEPHKKSTVKALDDNESLQLFSWHAFRQHNFIEGYTEYSESVVKLCCGVPLALEVLGSYLSLKTADEWEEELKKLKAIPHGKIQMSLRISYDSLQDDLDKNLFLHIACFFIGRDKDYVVKILDGCELYTEVGIQNLIDRHLITVTKDNKLMMHPLLRDMGKEIIRQESPEHPGLRSRLWHHEDALTVLQENIGTEAVKGFALNLLTIMQEPQNIISCKSLAKQQCHEELVSKYIEKQHNLGFFSWQLAEAGLMPSFPMPNEVVFETKAFAKMRNLKLLQLKFVKLNGGYELFPKNLVWLCWHGFHLNIIPSDLYLEKVVILDMQYSNLKHAWSGARAFEELKILNLSYSYGLVSTPDLSRAPNLEKLKLKSCINLVKVRKSVGNLKRLVLLNLKDCKSLRKLPGKVAMFRSLEELTLSGCSKLKLFSVIRNMESLKVLHADGISHTTKVPQSTFWPWSSKWQGMKSSLALTSLPRFLEHLSLADCNLSDDAVDLSSFFSLKHLNLSGNPVSCLLESINGLTKLESLVLDNCSNLQSLSELPTSLRELSAEKCISLERITYLPNLMRSFMLKLAGCEQLAELQNLFKLEPTNNRDKEMAKKLGLYDLGPVEGISIEMSNLMTLTSRIASPQVLRECGICSLFLPGSDVPDWYHSAADQESMMSFSVSPLLGQKVCGLNICFVYISINSRNGLFDHQYIKVWNKSKDLKWTYSPTFCGVPETGKSMLCLSHWKLGNHLGDGDQLMVSVDISADHRVRKLGVHLVYEPKEAEENMSFWHRLVNDVNVEMYRVAGNAFFLCNHGYLIHQKIAQCGWDNLRQYHHLFEQ